MQAGKVNSLTRIENIKAGLDYCEIDINGFPFKVFCDYNDYLRYIGLTIAFETRSDVYNGEMIEVIEGVIERKTVSTVDKESDIKLIPEYSEVRDICTFALDSLKTGDKFYDGIFYLSDMYVDSSPRAKWIQMKVVDIKSKCYEVRLFSSTGVQGEEMERQMQSFIGSYIKCSITLTKYGYQTESVTLYPVNVVEPPEVAVAISIIETAIEGDEQLISYMKKYDFIDALKRVIDIEPGYHLVRIASEISMINALSNISNQYSRQLLIRASIVSRGCLINRKNNLSKVVLNVNKIIRSDLAKDTELINTIDVLSEDTTPNKRVFIELSKFVRFIIDERRGNIDEKKIVDDIYGISNAFGGLL